MITVIASHGDLDGVCWQPATRECAVQWGRFRGRLVGRQAHGKAVLLHVESEELLEELLAECKSDIVILAEGALEELGGGAAHVPIISGGGVAVELAEGKQAAEKDAGGAQVDYEQSAKSLKDQAKVKELAEACPAAAAIAEEPAEAEGGEDLVEPEGRG